MSSATRTYPAFLGSEFQPPRPEAARYHVLPVPWERTVSYGGGTAAGPSAILEASWQLEAWDGQSVPGKEGIFTHAPVVTSGDPAEVLERIAAAVEGILDLGGLPIVLGGEHTVTYGVIQGYLRAGCQDFGVVQIDAHADLRNRYEDDPFSHACVMRRIVEAGVPLFQLGVRALCEEELAAREHYRVGSLDGEALVTGGIDQVSLPHNFPSQVFFTVDVDGIDPSVFPATGTPVPGGPGWYQTLSLFESVARQRRIIGFDLMELAPIPGFHSYDFAAALLIYKLMGKIQRIADGS